MIGGIVGGKTIADQMSTGKPPTPEMLELIKMGDTYHFAQWIAYSSTLWLLKASLLVLYMRLTVRNRLSMR